MTGRAATAVVLVIIALLVWAVIRAMPGAAPALGLAGGHKIAMLRWGSIYTEARPGAWLWGSPKRKSSVAYASAGEEIVLHSRASIDRGRIMVSVNRGSLPGEQLYIQHVVASGDHVIRVPVRDTGPHRVTANYVFNFRGRHELDWEVD